MERCRGAHILQILKTAEPWLFSRKNWRWHSREVALQHLIEINQKLKHDSSTGLDVIVHALDAQLFTPLHDTRNVLHSWSHTYCIAEFSAGWKDVHGWPHGLVTKMSAACCSVRGNPSRDALLSASPCGDTAGWCLHSHFGATCIASWYLPASEVIPTRGARLAAFALFPRISTQAHEGAYESLVPSDRMSWR